MLLMLQVQQKAQTFGNASFSVQYSFNYRVEPVKPVTNDCVIINSGINTSGEDVCLLAT